MEVRGADLAVVGRGMVFGVVVRVVGAAGGPMHVEVALTDTVTDPVETHVDGLRAALFDSVVGNAAGGAVVHGKDSGGLMTPHSM